MACIAGQWQRHALLRLDLLTPPERKPWNTSQRRFAVQTRFTPVFLRFSPDAKKLFLSITPIAARRTPGFFPIPRAGSGEPHPHFQQHFVESPRRRRMDALDKPPHGDVRKSAPTVNEQLWMADIEDGSLTRMLACRDRSVHAIRLSRRQAPAVFSGHTRPRHCGVPLDGSAPRTILSTDLPEFGPSWSPKGDQFAFVTQRNGTDELWLHSPQGNWDRPVVTAREFPTLQSIISPTFSPDGTRIAYTALLAGGGRRRSLAISPTGGGTPTIISDGYAPTWSLDGSTIAFLWLKSDGTIPVATIRVGSDDEPTEVVPNAVAWERQNGRPTACGSPSPAVEASKSRLLTARNSAPSPASTAAR